MEDVIFDFNVDAGPYAFRQFPQTSVAEVAEQLRALGVARAIIGSIPAITYVSPLAANVAFAAEVAALDNPALIPAAVLNPEYPGALDDLQRCRDLGFRALKLYPTYHNYGCAGYATVQLAQQAAEWGWPILLVVRIEDERHHHPLMKVPPLAMDDAITLARDLDPATMVLLGGSQPEAIRLLKTVTRENVLADVAWFKGPLNALQDTVGQVTDERLVFGSHLPFCYAQTAIAKVREAATPDECRTNILYANARRLLPVFN